MARRTKIIATLGPSTEEKSEIQALAEAGMNIARLNFSHGEYPQFEKIVKNIRTVEKEHGKIITIMQDLQGPKIRLGELPKEGIRIKKGEVITFTTRKSKNGIFIHYPALTKVLKKGHNLLIEDGLLRTKILSVKGDKVTAKVIAGGLLKSHKGINIPDSKLPAHESLTKKDKADLKFGVKTLKVDAIAVSFVESAKDIERVKKEISKYTKREVPVIAKIERREALKNLGAIINAADGVMVARGDLGIEIKAEMVPIEQKRILALARQQNKPVIIATQILQSMVENPLATRAEISDAANSIFELADAFMLSNETAVGKYPVKAVQTLAKVANAVETELFKNAELFPIQFPETTESLEDEAMALNAAVLSESINAKALVILTKHGYTARAVLKHRPETPILVVTNSIQTARALNFLWGVNEIVIHKGVYRSEEIKKFLVKEKFIKKGDDFVQIKLSDHKRSLVVMSV